MWTQALFLFLTLKMSHFFKAEISGNSFNYLLHKMLFFLSFFLGKTNRFEIPQKPNFMLIPGPRKTRFRFSSKTPRESHSNEKKRNTWTNLLFFKVKVGNEIWAKSVSNPSALGAREWFWQLLFFFISKLKSCKGCLDQQTKAFQVHHPSLLTLVSKFCTA